MVYATNPNNPNITATGNDGLDHALTGSEGAHEAGAVAGKGADPTADPTTKPPQAPGTGDPDAPEAKPPEGQDKPPPTEKGPEAKPHGEGDDPDAPPPEGKKVDAPKGDAPKGETAAPKGEAAAAAADAPDFPLSDEVIKLFGMGELSPELQQALQSMGDLGQKIANMVRLAQNVAREVVREGRDSEGKRVYAEGTAEDKKIVDKKADDAARLAADRATVSRELLNPTPRSLVQKFLGDLAAKLKGLEARMPPQDGAHGTEAKAAEQGATGKADAAPGTPGKADPKAALRAEVQEAARKAAETSGHKNILLSTQFQKMLAKLHADLASKLMNFLQHKGVELSAFMKLLSKKDLQKLKEALERHTKAADKSEAKKGERVSRQEGSDRTRKETRDTDDAARATAKVTKDVPEEERVAKNEIAAQLGVSEEGGTGDDAPVMAGARDLVSRSKEGETARPARFEVFGPRLDGEGRTPRAAEYSAKFGRLEGGIKDTATLATAVRRRQGGDGDALDERGRRSLDYAHAEDLPNTGVVVGEDGAPAALYAEGTILPGQYHTPDGRLINKWNPGQVLHDPEVLARYEAALDCTRRIYAMAAHLPEDATDAAAGARV